MAWITGRVQQGKVDLKPRDITVGEPFARKDREGIYYCVETGKRLHRIKLDLKQHIGTGKSATQDQEKEDRSCPQ